VNTSRRHFLRSSATVGTAVLSLREARSLFAEPARQAVAPPKSPFLLGNFAPVHEEITVDRLEVIGKLPAELRGMFVRNGPNPQFTPVGNYHWFDGDGMLHGVRLEEGHASYRNRYVRTEGWKEEREAGNALYGGLADPIDLKRILSGKQPFKNAANTALIWHDGRLLALWEGGPPTEIRVPELETVGLHTYGGKLRHAFTAHPKVDPVTGEMLFFGYSALSPLIHYSIVDPSGQLVSTTPIKVRRPVMMHDFAVTEQYSIFMDLPAEFRMEPAGTKGTTLHFDRERGSRFGVLARHGKGSEVRWFESPSCFVFHTVNAYEDGDEIVLLACRMPDYPQMLQLQDPRQPADADPLAAGKAVVYRWRFNLKSGETREEPLDEVACELPRVDERRLGRRTRFAYSMDVRSGRLIKYDLQRGTSSFHDFGAGRTGGEPVFVPRSADAEEDDGWLITYVFDAAEQRSEMVVIASREFSAQPVARVKIPARIPVGFHGTWIAADKLRQPA
jgi:carotenoid cleavage dioxygenase-like enzyme